VILRQEADRLTCVRQVDHAVLSGKLAATWGRSPWEVPVPRAGVLLGAAHHDDAWAAWDDTPEVRDGRPLGFHEVDRVTTSDMYAAGVDTVAAMDWYAGLLVSLHYSGFFSSHWGWQPFSTPDRFPEPQASALRRFVAAELARQGDLRRALGLDPGDERALEVNYKWLQLWDRVSLDICRQPADQPWLIEYPAAPASYNRGAEVPLKFAMVAPGRYTMNPYPLSEAPFRVSLPAVALPLGPFASRESFLEQRRAAPAVTIAATLEPV
jgi:hypothetical protein